MAETPADKYQAARNNSESVQRGGVTSSVNSRKVGPQADPRAYLERNPPETDNDNDNGANDHGPFADKWEAKFSYLPGEGPSEQDERSSRQRLEDGKTVTTE
jgi:hypothetical protein